ncbi:hypothetical protein N9022_00900 [bacterium]|nr:hypothetical protein [bacterium]
MSYGTGRIRLDSLGRYTELAVFFNPGHCGSANFLRGLDEDKRAKASNKAYSASFV